MFENKIQFNIRKENNYEFLIMVDINVVMDFEFKNKMIWDVQDEINKDKIFMQLKKLISHIVVSENIQLFKI